MNINTMNDSAVTKALNARIKAKGCSFGSMAEANWWARGFEQLHRLNDAKTKDRF